MATPNLPLEGGRVVEMTHMVMGPTCGMILAQLGAEVIKVEPPAGDKTRSLGGMGTAFFPLFNRGKRSVVLDLAIPADRDTMHRLLETADVFLENFRDGQLEKQGLGAEELCRRHPHLIIAGHKARSMPEREHAWPIYDIFDAAGDGRIFIGVVTEGHWQAFCREFSLTEFLDDPTLRTTTDRILARPRILPRVAEIIRQRDVA